MHENWDSNLFRLSWDQDVALILIEFCGEHCPDRPIARSVKCWDCGAHEQGHFQLLHHQHHNLSSWLLAAMQQPRYKWVHWTTYPCNKGPGGMSVIWHKNYVSLPSEWDDFATLRSEVGFNWICKGWVPQLSYVQFWWLEQLSLEARSIRNNDAIGVMGIWWLSKVRCLHKVNLCRSKRRSIHRSCAEQIWRCRSTHCRCPTKNPPVKWCPGHWHTQQKWAMSAQADWGHAPAIWETPVRSMSWVTRALPCKPDGWISIALLLCRQMYTERITLSGVSQLRSRSALGMYSKHALSAARTITLFFSSDHSCLQVISCLSSVMYVFFYSSIRWKGELTMLHAILRGCVGDPKLYFWYVHRLSNIATRPGCVQWLIDTVKLSHLHA